MIYVKYHTDGSKFFDDSISDHPFLVIDIYEKKKGTNIWEVEVKDNRINVLSITTFDLYNNEKRAREYFEFIRSKVMEDN